MEKVASALSDEQRVQNTSRRDGTSTDGSGIFELIWTCKDDG